ncbi:MAG: PduL/EutD family phosphate acyltransferase [archaeon]
MKIKVEVSGRHAHLSKEHLHKLFGEGYELNKKRDISQPGQYVAHEKVSLVNGDLEIRDVKILGPVRNKTQIEILEEDVNTLEVNAPLRISGNIKNSAGIKIKGPFGEIELNEGVIRAERHIHLSLEDLEKVGFKDGDYANLKIREDIIKCMVRSGKDHSTAVHLDKDDAKRLNLDAARAVGEDVFGEIL